MLNFICVTTSWQNAEQARQPGHCSRQQPGQAAIAGKRAAQITCPGMGSWTFGRFLLPKVNKGFQKFMGRSVGVLLPRGNEMKQQPASRGGSGLELLLAATQAGEDPEKT
ncbi:MAG: hypothetical protein FWG56_08230 [Desulfovibrionaceae bacterium]|nr:hypothetical protein [Desulfovibrionaceae bacterium]